MKNLISIAVVFGALAANAGWNLDLASGWRIIGGANYNAGLKTDLNVSGANAMSAMPSVPAPGGATRAQAEAASRKILDGQRVDFPNGGFVDPDYSGRGELPEYTWNWQAPAGAYRDGAMTFGYDYTEVSSVGSGNGILSERDSRDMAGFTVELQRNFGQWGRFGLDAAFGFNYYHRDNAFRSSGTVYRRTDSVERGRTETSVAMDSAMADWAKNADGSYGAGTYDGPGALMSLGAGSFSFANRSLGRTAATHSLALDSSADYEEIELTLAAKPYYDLTEWFRIVGTLGVVVSRGELDFDMSGLVDGARTYGSSEKFSQWDCYGIGGLGGMFHYWHTCLGFDFLARFLDRDIDIDGRDVSGSVERCPWMFRVYAGFEF